MADARPGDSREPIRVSLWLPVTPFFAALAPFAMLLAPLLLLAPPMWRVHPYLAAFAMCRVLLSLGGTEIDVDGATTALFVFKTVADPFAGRINLFRVLKGTATADTTLVNLRAKGKERIGALL